MTGTSRKKLSPSERVSAAAKDLFIKNGYASVSIDEIARQARVSKPTLYAHFGSKERLFVTVLEDAFNKIVAPLLNAESSNLPIEEVLTAHARSYARAVLSPDMLDINRLLIAEAVRFPEMASHYYNAGPGSAYSAVADFLRSRVKIGEIVCEDCAGAARLYGAMIIATHRLRLQLHVDAEPNWTEVDDLSALAVKIFTRGMKP